MRKEERLLKAYLKSPVNNIKAGLFTGEGKESGIRFEYADIRVLVYENGDIAIYGHTKGTAESLAFLEKTSVPLYKLAKMTANDFQIMNLREECRDSLIYVNDYDQKLVNRHLEQWEEYTGRLVSLTGQQKRNFYEELMCGFIPPTDSDITDWLSENQIPTIYPGKIIIDVTNKDKRQIRVESIIQKLDSPNGIRQMHEINMLDSENIDVPFASAMSEVRLAFGVNPIRRYERNADKGMTVRDLLQNGRFDINANVKIFKNGEWNNGGSPIALFVCGQMKNAGNNVLDSHITYITTDNRGNIVIECDMGTNDQSKAGAETNEK